jgi:K+-sensing histidine kinase KdpD
MNREKIKIDLLIHDLKVPLAVIESGITLLLQKPEKYGRLTEKQKKVLNRTLRNTRVTQMLVNDLLELGRSREGIVVTYRSG